MGWIEVVFGISVQGSLSFPLKAHENVNLQTPGSETSINTTHKPSDLRFCICDSCFLSALIGHLSKAATYLPIFAFRFYIPKWAPVHQNTPAFKLFLMMFRSLDTNLTSLSHLKGSPTHTLQQMYLGKEFNTCTGHPDLSASCSNAWTQDLEFALGSRSDHINPGPPSW